MPYILIRPRAKADLADIWGYIAEDSEARADAFVESIDMKLQTLAENPSIGKGREALGEGIRSFPVGRYIIFYRPLLDGIDVIRVLHSARDLDAVFERDEMPRP